MQIDLPGNDRLLSDDNFDFYQFLLLLLLFTYLFIF